MVSGKESKYLVGQEIIYPGVEILSPEKDAIGVESGAGFATINRRVSWPSDDIIFTIGGYRFISKWGSEGNGDGQFLGPFGVVVDDSGNIFVADTYNHRIQVFAPFD